MRLLMLGLLLVGGFVFDRMKAAESGEAYVHTFTGFTFPIQVAKFTRGRITPYNAEKSDIEVDYRNEPYTTLLSVYVYPFPGTLQAHYRQCCADVFKVTPSAKLISEEPVTMERGGATYHGLMARFSIMRKLGGSEDVEALSQLRLFQFRDYWVLYRISYLKSRQKECEQEIDEFLQTMAWPRPDPGI